MGVVGNNVDDSTRGNSLRSNAHEEKIFVSIRLRPLNEREIANNDASDWDCINNTTLVFRNSASERSTSPTAYSFDRVFGNDSSTRQVYEEGARSVALSVVSGINSSIFAYGQTSSGKTYTMSGITGHTVADIYDYVDKNTSRKFILKFSAMEIYNEAVRDLLSSDNTPLRLLDDPERGTVVEKLSQITLKDKDHLRELLSVCEAQRQIGETALNEMSSRSHQILRLTVESSPREYKRFENSATLTATVNFVDLAGSERASQTMSAGTRLKEGSHINRSLLTLGTVIRKLSKGRNGHVPYRDSKLTRILQNSLGGNARTAIICTMSPAHSHVEQSRNTLLFASCAKQVSTNAHVNVMMSEKALIKQLQRELARLENQLKNLGSLSMSGDSDALKEKELLIQKMDREIRELTQQRDQAHFRLQNLVPPAGEYQRSKHWDEQSSISESHEKLAWFGEYAASETSEIIDPLRFDAGSIASYFSDRSEGLNLNKRDEQIPEPSEEQFLSDDTSPRLFIEKYFGPDPTKGWEKTAQGVDMSTEDTCKEVQCIEIVTTTNKASLDSGPFQGNDNLQHQEMDHIHHDKETLDPAIEEKQKTMECVVNGSEHPEPSPCSSDSESPDPNVVDLSRSRSSGAVLTTTPPSRTPEMEKEDDTRFIGVKDSIKSHVASEPELSKLEEPALDGKNCQEDNLKESLDMVESTDGKQQIIMSLGLHDKKIKSEKQFRDIVNSTDGKQQIIMSLGLDDKMVKPEKQFTNNLVQEAESILTPTKMEKDFTQVPSGENDLQKSPSNWPMEFEKQRAEIIQLWDACNIALVHRSYFYLVFKGDPSDAIYMEVELRRLSYLKDSRGTNIASMKVLKREREMLSKLMLKKFSAKEREALFLKYGIGLKTKRRRLQLCRKLWTDTKDMEHIKESAALVAKLVGYVEELSQVPKEVVGLTFSTPQVNIRSFSWKNSMPSLI
ncbi:OLC1v1024332C1 [Oldenlandia corymbosa var. corymbosa]|uniref:Kinesin-like protein n=1 Tax=Oldenlandia corymbosa var. corymbosa TaxID=529605 RepID=A0AAV1C4J1_OLDCO|nr:OLC1v1024332C1 [Oldenlandia corymbosa var. corymbosa]